MDNLDYPSKRLLKYPWFWRGFPSHHDVENSRYASRVWHCPDCGAPMQVADSYNPDAHRRDCERRPHLDG